jgi:hypothetical protein
MIHFTKHQSLARQKDRFWARSFDTAEEAEDFQAVGVIWLNGSWTERPLVGNHEKVGPSGMPPPHGEWFTSVAIRSSAPPQKILEEQRYSHPNCVVSSHDYNVCVELPSVEAGHTIVITPGDPLNLHVIDARDKPDDTCP